MKGKSDKFFNLIRLRRATLLALFALASMQLALAGHQFDHSAGTVAETCHVCVQADRLDDAAVDETPSATIRAEKQADVVEVVATIVDDTTYRNFNSRAPPTL